MPPYQDANPAMLAGRLTEGETIIAQARIHEGIYWPAAATLCIALIFALFIAPELGFFLAMVSIAVAAYAIMRKSILMLVVTNKRFLVRSGILQVDIIDLHFDKVESVQLERMLPGFLMGYATVIITGTGNRLIFVPYVANAQDIREAYNAQVLQSQKAGQ